MCSPFPEPQLSKASTEVFRQDRKHQTTWTCRSSTWQVGRPLCTLWMWMSLLVAPLLGWELPSRDFSKMELLHSEELCRAARWLLTKRNETLLGGTSRGRGGCFL